MLIPMAPSFLQPIIQQDASQRALQGLSYLYVFLLTMSMAYTVIF